MTPADALAILWCPRCHGTFELLDDAGTDEPSFRCTSCGARFPTVRGVPRLVVDDNYAESFGYQWTRFSKVQLDSYNGTQFSKDRFDQITEWSPSDLRGKLVLDAGCGAGRFAEVVAGTYGARVVAIDLSAAVDACRSNLNGHDALVCQASIYEPGLREGLFDFVYSIGVIQHTPDPYRSIASLCRLVKPGGQIGLWIYQQDWKSFVGTAGFKYALRPITKRLPRKTQLALCRALVDLFFPIIPPLMRAGLPGKVLLRLLPVASMHLQGVNLSREDLRTWVFLDTFDMYTPAFDQPQRFEQVAAFLRRAGFEAIRQHPHGGVAVTARRPLGGGRAAGPADR